MGNLPSTAMVDMLCTIASGAGIRLTPISAAGVSGAWNPDRQDCR